MTPARSLLPALLLAVLLVACGDDAPADPPAASGEAGSSVTIEAGDLYFAPESVSVAPGEVEFILDNTGAAEHDLVIEELDDLEVVFAAPGERAAGTVTLEAGTYTFYCSIPGHRSLMEGILEVG